MKDSSYTSDINDSFWQLWETHLSRELEGDELKNAYQYYKYLLAELAKSDFPSADVVNRIPYSDDKANGTVVLKASDTGSDDYAEKQILYLAYFGHAIGIRIDRQADYVDFTIANRGAGCELHNYTPKATSNRYIEHAYAEDNRISALHTIRCSREHYDIVKGELLPIARKTTFNSPSDLYAHIEYTLGKGCTLASYVKKYSPELTNRTPQRSGSCTSKTFLALCMSYCKDEREFKRFKYSLKLLALQRHLSQWQNLSRPGRCWQVDFSTQVYLSYKNSLTAKGGAWFEAGELRVMQAELSKIEVEYIQPMLASNSGNILLYSQIEAMQLPHFLPGENTKKSESAIELFLGVANQISWLDHALSKNYPVLVKKNCASNHQWYFKADVIHTLKLLETIDNKQRYKDNKLTIVESLLYLYTDYIQDGLRDINQSRNKFDYEEITKLLFFFIHNMKNFMANQHTDSVISVAIMYIYTYSQAHMIAKKYSYDVKAVLGTYMGYIKF